MELSVKKKISVEQFRDLLDRSTLGERRPIEDTVCLEGMIENSNLLVTAWEGELLVGVARSMTDFHYACYLSDLAVDREYQRQGIGKALIETTQQQLNERCKLILIASPSADEYYGKIGFTRNERCWILQRNEAIH